MVVSLNSVPCLLLLWSKGGCWEGREQEVKVLANVYFPCVCAVSVFTYSWVIFCSETQMTVLQVFRDET